MKTAIDFNPALVHKYSGFYSYGTGLLEGFAKLDERPDITLFYSHKFQDWAKEIHNTTASYCELRPMKIKNRWLEKYWSVMPFPHLENLIGEFDVYHCLHHLMPPVRNKPRVMTIYDLRRYKLRELYTRSKLGLFERAVSKADHFIAISQSCKEDLCELFRIGPDRVDVVYLACPPSRERPSSEEKQELLEKIRERHNRDFDYYYITFSSPDARKNIPAVMEAFNKAKRNMPGKCCLFVIGNPSKSETDIEKIRNLQNDDIIFTGPVENLDEYLCGAGAMIFASLYEGFGIPIVEAFSAGVPVITSNRSSMPEVAGDAAIIVNPYDTDEIAEATVKLSNDDALREKLIEAGRERLKNFSLTKTARETLNVYKKLI